jgi:hypothetical protein
MIKNIKQFLFIAGLLLIAAGAQPVGAAIWQWSTTASTNATADPSINWAEGMAPSAVNDSARAMMAVLAAQNRDQGQITSGGTAAAITLTTNTGYPNIAALNGQLITFQHSVAAGNADGATIAIDSIGALPLYVGTSPITGGTLVDRGVYTIACYSSNSRCHLVNRYQDSFSIPLGAVLWSTSPTAPNASFVAPSGQCISTTTYAAYWVQQGSPASGACPGGQFAIIDMRGRVPAALDTLNASAAGRLTSASTGCGTAMTAVGATCTNGTESYIQTVAQMATHSHSVTDPGHTHGITPSNNLILDAGDPGSNTFGSGSYTPVQLSINSATTGVTIQNTGGATATPKVMPTIGLIPYLRIL